MIKSLLGRIAQRKVDGREPILDIGYNGVQGQPRALISYLNDGLHFGVQAFPNVSNREEAALTLQAFLEKGYVVDLLDCRSREFPCNRRTYDLVWGFGEPYRTARIKNSGKRVLYLTEGPPDISLNNEGRRIDYLKARHGIRWPMERTGTYYNDSDIVIADVVVALGGKHAAHIAAKFGKAVDVMSPIGLAAEAPVAKNFGAARSNFLWFGSRGFVHKGLDVLIDSIRMQPQLNLHVCGISEEALPRCFRGVTGVKYYGRISVDSGMYRRLVEMCGYSMLLSASEACPTGIITTMKSGLLPIISENCGTNFDGMAEVVPEQAIQVEAVAKLLQRLSEVDAAVIEKRSSEVAVSASSQYVAGNFSAGVSRILHTLGSR